MSSDPDTDHTAEADPRWVARAFFTAFDEAFPTFDGDVIARRYAEPYLACRADGSAEVFTDRAATGRYFAGLLADYRDMGVRTCTHRDLEVVDLGARHLLATVTWDLLDGDGAVVVTWRESYVLAVGDEALVRTSVDFPDQG